MTPNNPYQAYQKKSVMSMTPGDMLTALYNGALKELEIAKTAFLRKDITEINHRLQKVQRIFGYLKGTLNFDYEISVQLDALYDYFMHVAAQANIKKDAALLDEIIPMITELRDAYIQADKKARAAGVH